MTLTLTLMAALPSARADVGAGDEAEVPARLVRRALARAGLATAPARARAWAAPLLPTVGVETRVAPPTWRVDVSLLWPLDDAAGAAAGEEREERRRAERRERLTARVARLWRARTRLGSPGGRRAADPLARRLEELRAAELEAELEALTGEPWATATAEARP